MIRLALPLILMGGAAFAHGGHEPVAPSLHGVVHLGAPVLLVVLAGAAGFAILRIAASRRK